LEKEYLMWDNGKSRAFGQKREKTKPFLIFSPKALA
jgi:hypothetical protein